MCLFNLLLCIQQPANKGGGSTTACLRPKNSIYDQKSGIFCCSFMKNGKFWCLCML